MSAHEYLIKKGFKKVYQSKKRYNLTMAELISLLEDFVMQQKDKNVTQHHDIDQMKLWM